MSMRGDTAARTTEATERLSSPFEEWCADRGVHPEHWAAWPTYEAEQLAARSSRA